MVDSQHLQITELATDPQNAEIANHFKGEATGLRRNSLFDTNPIYKGARMPINVQVAVGKTTRWNLI
jgi:hypothetical protein